VYQLLLERGAGPYDIQVLYNTHFSADMIWWLEPTYRHSLAHGMKADWDDPAWRMLDMGGYGPGAYFVLDHAIRKNRVALAEWALAHGADPNVMSSPHPKFRPKRSLLEQAVLHGRTEIADLLRRHGARAAATAPLEPWEAFVDACVRLDRGAVVAALAREPRLSGSPEPLFEAARLNRPDVLALLAGAGYALDTADAHNTRALHHAAAANALDAARFLLERGVDPDPRETRWNATPIGWASHADHAEMIDLLSRNSRNIWTLSFRGYVDRVREILAQDPALARQADADGITPLWWLPDDEQKALGLVNLLIDAGADPAAKSGSGRTAADWARRRGMLDVAARLEAHADPRASDSE
jgi:ankyrin repeat protein